METHQETLAPTQQTLPLWLKCAGSFTAAFVLFSSFAFLSIFMTYKVDRLAEDIHLTAPLYILGATTVVEALLYLSYRDRNEMHYKHAAWTTFGCGLGYGGTLWLYLAASPVLAITAWGSCLMVSLILWCAVAPQRFLL